MHKAAARRDIRSAASYAPPLPCKGKRAAPSATGHKFANTSKSGGKYDSLAA